MTDFEIQSERMQLLGTITTTTGRVLQMTEDLPAGDILYVERPAAAAAWAHREGERLDALVDGLRPLIGRERHRRLVDAINALATAIDSVWANRLIALACQADGWGEPAILIRRPDAGEDGGDGLAAAEPIPEDC